MCCDDSDSLIWRVRVRGEFRIDRATGDVRRYDDLVRHELTVAKLQSVADTAYAYAFEAGTAHVLLQYRVRCVRESLELLGSNNALNT